VIDLESKLDSILRFDQLSYKDYPLNSISPVVKLNVLIVYLVCVVSVSKYDVFHIYFAFICNDLSSFFVTTYIRNGLNFYIVFFPFCFTGGCF